LTLWMRRSISQPMTTKLRPSKPTTRRPRILTQAIPLALAPKEPTLCRNSPSTCRNKPTSQSQPKPQGNTLTKLRARRPKTNYLKRSARSQPRAQTIWSLRRPNSALNRCISRSLTRPRWAALSSTLSSVRTPKDASKPSVVSTNSTPYVRSLRKDGPAATSRVSPKRSR